VELPNGSIAPFYAPGLVSDSRLKASQNIKTVVVSCQGTIQLISALAAMSRDESIVDGVQKHLFVSELYVDTQEINAFLSVIREMAEVAGKWASITYIPPEALPHDSKSSEQFTAFRNAITEVIQPEDIDCVYVSTSSHVSNRAFIALALNARIVCYGDGPGIYIPMHYRYLTRQSVQVGIWHTLIEIFSSANLRLRRECLQTATRKILRNRGHLVDFGYFLLPSLNGEHPPFEFEPLSVSDFLLVLHAMTKTVKEERFAQFLGSKLQTKIKVLLTSNFSEAGRMNMEDELQAYCEFITEHQPSNEISLIVKPHPRDSRAKISFMKSYFSQRFTDVFVLDSILEKFMPLEILLLDAKDKGVAFEKMQFEFLAVSSAVLSLKHLLGVTVRLGFGQKITQIHFSPEEAELRQRHERDLRRLISER
jgi:hypothetical protein